MKEALWEGAKVVKVQKSKDGKIGIRKESEVERLEKKSNQEESNILRERTE